MPIYSGLVNGRARFTIAYYQDGRWVRKIFGNLAVAKVEAGRAATVIQEGQTHNLDFGPSARTEYVAAKGLLEPRGQRAKFCEGPLSASEKHETASRLRT